MAFSDRLRLLREESGLSQAEVAHRLGVDDSAISQWENGRRQPNLALAKRLAGVFGVTLDFLVEDPEKNNTSISSLRVFLRASRRLTHADLESLLDFTRFVAQAKPGELKVPDDPITRAHRR